MKKVILFIGLAHRDEINECTGSEFFTIFFFAS